ncbi:MAG: SDR family oxidoreductase [Bacteroidales bacterium]|jgi:NAD(P)-dependent dehydrogenase (short-subunit alcohol dehydrogenase family)|nr:SDR family oxidoreductase [Bacteroidales bacterium]
MNKRFDLKGKIVLITGASSGIGRQTAIAVSECGGSCVITGRNNKRLSETMKMLKSKGHTSMIADLTNESDIKNLVENLPEVNGLVHCAGITPLMPAKFIKPKHIDEVMEVNYNAAVLLTSQMLSGKKISDHASIVFISSIATRFPYFGGSLYVSSKSALQGYSAVLALELSPRGIRSNCLLPGFVKTPMFDETLKHTSEEAMKKFKDLHPLGFGDPEDVAGPVCFLLSDAARWLTGVNIPLGASI